MSGVSTTDRPADAPKRDAYLSLGANVGARAHNLAQALALLDATEGLTLRRLSSVYETEPVGFADQPHFLNLVACFSCSLPAQALLAVAKDVERQMGRVHTRRWGPRLIDVDILLLGEERISSPELTIPHPEMLRRQFVLVPLAEIAPELRLSGGRTAAELAQGESAAVRRLGTLEEVVARERPRRGSDR